MSVLDNLVSVFYFAVALLVALVAHEYAHAWTAVRLGDQTPRQAGRLSLNPKPLVDPFGTLILPAILLLPVLFGGGLFPVFGYAKPMPLNPWSLRRGERDVTIVALAGPAINLVLAFIFGLLFRALAGSGPVADLILRCLQVNVILAVIHFVPIPPLDGARMISRFLPPRAREVYGNLDQYGALFVLLIFFLLPGPIFAFVDVIGNGVCSLVVGAACLG
ncbi:MAG: site-2 protease family protein [Actinobacteria bacterium]|nr:site-2 protease family protein [Actinomycetota bacterium]